MRLRTLRPALLVPALLLGLVVVPGPSPVSASGDTSDAAEQYLLTLINRDRAAAGLVPMRTDARLREIARARSTDMATNGYFSHEQPDGRNVFDLISAAGITWYGAGEILAWNTQPTLTESAVAADAGWLGSAGHRAIVMSTDYNYAAFGLAVAPDGRKLWTGVFLKGPDRTRPTARAAGISRRRSSRPSPRAVAGLARRPPDRMSRCGTSPPVGRFPMSCPQVPGRKSTTTSRSRWRT